MPDSHLAADDARKPGRDVEHRPVLDIRPVADGDGRFIAAQHGPKPYADVFAQRDVARTNRRVGDPYSWLEWPVCWKVPSVYRLTPGASIASSVAQFDSGSAGLIDLARQPFVDQGDGGHGIASPLTIQAIIAPKM